MLITIQSATNSALKRITGGIHQKSVQHSRGNYEVEVLSAFQNRIKNGVLLHTIDQIVMGNSAMTIFKAEYESVYIR